MATADPNAIRDAAASYAEMGFRVIEIYGQKNGFCHCSKGGNCGKNAGKHPVRKQWEDPDQPSFVPKDGSRSNIGIATGPTSNLLVVDVDTDDGKDGVASLATLLDEHAHEWPTTYTTRTGGGGWQYYFRYPDFGGDIGNSAGKLGPGIDTRGKGGYVVAPPSVSGKGPYKVVRDVPVADAPEWLLELLRPKVRETQVVEYDPGEHDNERLGRYEDAIVKQEIARLRELSERGWDVPWDQTTFEVACNLFELANAEWSRLPILRVPDLIFDNVPPWDDEGWDEARVQAKIDSAERTVGDEATPPPADLPSDQDLLREMVGEDAWNNPDGPAAESAVKLRAEVVAPEATAFTEPALPDPPSAHFEGAAIVEWLERSLVAGSADLFWEVVGAVLSGDASLPVQVAIKGAPGLTAALLHGLGGIPAPEEGVAYVGGVGISTIETDHTDVVLEFDANLDLTSGSLAAVRDRALEAYSKALQRGTFAAADETVATRDVGDYRINSMLRSHIGQRRTDRGDADEFNV